MSANPKWKDEFDAKMQARRLEVRETFRKMSDRALDYQSTIVVGGFTREELDRELARRAQRCQHLNETSCISDERHDPGYDYAEVTCADCGEYLRDEVTPR